MQFKALLIGVLVFIAAIVIGLIASEPPLYLGEIPQPDAVRVKEVPVPIITGDGHGTGSGIGTGVDTKPSEYVPPAAPCEGTCKVKILSKPRANYTDAARQNNVQGSVTLRITFLASGEIGGISPVKRLPDGLTEQAIAAARKIRFHPATKDGVPYTTSATIQYGFTIY